MLLSNKKMTEPVRTPAPSRENNFNLLRLVFAVLVLAAHSPEIIDGNRSRELLTVAFGTISFGQLAVDGFFLLSGFLIMQSWHTQPDWRAFLSKRVLRIYPGFLVASVICAFVVGPLGAEPRSYFADFDLGRFVSHALLLQIPAVPAVFQGQPYPDVNGAMWTISREFACYLLVLAMGAIGALRLRHFWLALTGAVFALLVALLLLKRPMPDITLLSFFCSGACFYLYRDKLVLRGWIALALTLVAAVCMFSWRASELALAIAGAYALMYVAHKRSPFWQKFNALPDVSYGVYLYGWPIQKLIFWYFPAVHPGTLFVAATGAALLMGLASWYAVEKPALRFKRKAAPLPVTVNG